MPNVHCFYSAFLNFILFFYFSVASTLFPVQRFLETMCFVNSEVSNDEKGDGELFICDNGYWIGHNLKDASKEQQGKCSVLFWYELKNVCLILNSL